MVQGVLGQDAGLGPAQGGAEILIVFLGLAMLGLALWMTVFVARGAWVVGQSVKDGWKEGWQSAKLADSEDSDA